MSFVAREQTLIHPINAPSDGYSFRRGFPLVQFEVAASSKFLQGSSLRLNGTLRLNAAPSTEATPIGPNNKVIVGAAGGAANGGRSTGSFMLPAGAAGGANTDTAGIALDARTGVQSCISQITISSGTGQTLEVVRNYGRYIASATPATHSQSDFDTSEQIQCCCASRGANAAQLVNNDVSFSIPLRTGLLKGETSIPLGTNGVRGLVIELTLASDAAALSGFTAWNIAGLATNPTTFNEAGVAAGAFYQLRDLTLSYDQLVPEDAPAAPATGTLVYNSLSSLYSVINTPDSTTTLNLNTRRTLSVFHNTIPAGQLNSYASNSFATPRLQDSTNVDTADEQVSFSRAGILFPIENIVDVEWPPLPGSNRPLTEVSTNYINSLKSYNRWNHCLMSPETQIVAPSNTNGLGFIATEDVNGVTKRPNNGADPVPLHGYGVREDVFKHGVDFSRSNYGIRVKSTGLDAPNALFTYTLAQNTLSYSPSGITVSS